MWRYQVLQQVKTIICEGSKFYKKLKPIMYFKCSIYLWVFKNIQWCYFKILNLFSKVYFQGFDSSSYFSKRLVLTKGCWVGFESWEPKPQGLTFQNQEPTNIYSNPLVDALPSPGVNPLEGSPKCSWGKWGLGRHSRLPAL